MQLTQKPPKPCLSCSKLTKYICIDCVIDRGKFIPMCDSFQCKNKHKIDVHTKVVNAKAATG